MDWIYNPVVIFIAAACLALAYAATRHRQPAHLAEIDSALARVQAGEKGVRIAAGADEVIIKPVAMGALLNAMGRMAAKSSSGDIVLS